MKRNIGLAKLASGDKCPYFKCEFIRKYENSLGLVVDGMMKVFCNGSKMRACKRKQYRDKYKREMDVNIMPNGNKLMEK